jgi:DNA-binding NarL/FixJ family response regulator
MRPLRVILADDHAMFRQGVRRILEELPGVEIVAEAQDGLALLHLLKNLEPDLIILDISMPNLRGMEAAREIKAIRPNVKILILTMHKESEYLYGAMKVGVDGFLLKEDADAELHLALKALLQGKMYISPLLSEQLPDLLSHLHRKGSNEKFDLPLTDRERQILKLIAEGKSSKEIGALLFISDRTVQNHRASIMKKLHFKSVADLVKYAVQKGFT